MLDGVKLLIGMKLAWPNENFEADTVLLELGELT